MRAALVIAGKDLKQRLRDRSALVLGFIAPLVIAGLMSVAFSGTDDIHVSLGVVDADGGPLATALVDVLRSPELADIVSVETVETVQSVAGELAAEAAVRDGDLGAALLVPEGFSAAAVGAEPVPLTVLASVDATISAAVAEAIAEAFVAQLNANRLSVAVALEAGAGDAALPELIAAVGEARLPERLHDEGTGARQLRAIEYYGPSMAIFFVLFAVGFGARAFFLERQAGTLDRMAAAPIRPAALLAGKALSVFVFASASLATVVTASALVFGAAWGSPMAVAAICLAMALAVTALTALVTAAARTERQAEGMASVAIFGLALAGGNFVFVSVAPELLRRLALLTPNGWALRGFTDLATGAAPFESAAAPVLAILAFTVVAGTTAGVLARRVVLQ